MELTSWGSTAFTLSSPTSEFGQRTSTAPSFFHRAPFRCGGAQFEDLVFGFQAARTADPHAILSQMVKAARYVQD